MFFSFLVYAGLKVHSQFRPKSLQPPPWNDNDSEHCLAKICSNTLSLKQLSRISIRSRLITNIKEESANLQPFSHVNRDGSIMEHLISSLRLPKSMERYLYDFPDVAPLKNANNPTF